MLAMVGLGSRKMGDHIDRLSEEGLHAGQGGSMTQSCRQMGFAQAVAGDKNQPFIFFKKSEFHGFEEFGFGNGCGMVPFEAVQGFDFGKLGGGQA